MKNLKTVVAIAIIAIMLLVVVLPTNAAFDGVTYTVTSNVGNGTEVKPGDEIVYTIKVKNASENNYIVPTIIAYAPKQTEIVDIEIDKASENDTKELEKEAASYVGFILPANSEVNFKLKVKIADNATGEIKFANVTEDDEEGYGAILTFLAKADVTDEELSNFANINLDNFNSVEEVQKAIGDNIYFNIITQPQSNPIKAEEKTEEPKTEEPKAEEPKTEEPKAEEPKAEEPVKEETKTEEKKEESTNKPTKLPKTGIEYNVFAIIAGIIMLALGIKLVK